MCTFHQVKTAPWIDGYMEPCSCVSEQRIQAERRICSPRALCCSSGSPRGSQRTDAQDQWRGEIAAPPTCIKVACWLRDRSSRGSILSRRTRACSNSHVDSSVIVVVTEEKPLGKVCQSGKQRETEFYDIFMLKMMSS